MTAQVEFHYDFGSPNCYFSHLVIPEVEKRTGVKFTYFPILLGGVFKLTNNKSPMEQFKEIPLKMDYMRLETKRFIEAHNLTKFHMNPNFPVNTVQIMRGALAAEKEGCADRYIDAVFTAMWEDGKKMDDPGVIQDVLNDAGLDAEKIMARTQDQDIKDTLINYTNSSVERGCFGAPMFFVGDEMFFGKDRLDTVEQEILNQK
ncbi:MAG: disulfide bond formation protein DsbA [Sneathiella sp.]|uniref:2-hydroxychromene-2-carboxylate isomerase n=1 Tax=Sneathiella sp. TaxID=1964365 RepID=UPI000C5414ED|nr:2-hydroxychromene-2-carboxylate isomerase [Sneathiella sp.]MAZ04142.1 disulfide bond formation protein DsbA [Sneathiella sp.]|tara:strand:- start:1259 stop:1867 length:609 start_codon:yes stop_codon:yes gene_type:complete